MKNRAWGWNKIQTIVSSRLFLKLTFVWFAFQALYISLSTRLGVSPDETYHYGLAKLFKQNGWLPFIHNQYGNYQLGEVVHTPYFLYHYLLSLPMHLIGGWHTLELLRLINIALAVWSLVLIVKLARRLKASPLVTNLSVFMMVNTLMFTFLSGFLNYDNLLIPLSLLSFIFLFDFLDKPVFSNLFKLFVVCLAGSMTAINYLPILAGVAALVVYKLVREIKARRALIDGLTHLQRLNKILLVLGVILSLLFIQRYVLNVVRYHSITPGCLRFQTQQQCSQNGIFARPQNFPAIPNHPHPTPFEYSTDWGWSMRARTFGILGHESISDNKAIRLWTEALLFVGTLVAVRYYRPTRNWNILIAIGVFYTAILFTKDWWGYYHSGYNFGVQGRYTLLFLPFVYILFNQHLLKFLKKAWLKSAYVVLTLLVFIISALPTYTLKTDSSWYKNPRATRINNDIRRIEQKIIP